MKDRDGNEWRMVPVSPSKEMFKAAESLHSDRYVAMGTALDYWTAMLAAIPQFVVGEVDDALCERIGRDCAEATVNAAIAHAPALLPIDYAAWGCGMIAAVRSELGPALGLVEIREPTREDYIAISEKYAGIQREQVGTLVHASVSAGMMREGRDIFNAVSKWLKGEL